MINLKDLILSNVCVEFTYAGNASNNLVTKNKQLNMYKDTVKGSLIVEKISNYLILIIFEQIKTQISILIIDLIIIKAIIRIPTITPFLSNYFIYIGLFLNKFLALILLFRKAFDHYTTLFNLLIIQ